MRYEIIEDAGKIGVKNLETNQVMYPSCGQDLKGFCAYQDIGERDALLESVFHGATPISDMLAKVTYTEETKKHISGKFRFTQN